MQGDASTTASGATSLWFFVSVSRSCALMQSLHSNSSQLRHRMWDGRRSPRFRQLSHDGVINFGFAFWDRSTVSRRLLMKKLSLSFTTPPGGGIGVTWRHRGQVMSDTLSSLPAWSWRHWRQKEWRQARILGWWYACRQILHVRNSSLITSGSCELPESSIVSVSPPVTQDVLCRLTLPMMLSWRLVYSPQMNGSVWRSLHCIILLRISSNHVMFLLTNNAPTQTIVNVAFSQARSLYIYRHILHYKGLASAASYNNTTNFLSMASLFIMKAASIF